MRPIKGAINPYVICRLSTQFADWCFQPLTHTLPCTPVKGHTYTLLDQTFNTMMMFLRQVGIYCVKHLMKYIWSALRKYDCLEVIELHALWDWGEYFKPHVSTRLGGFCTSQYGSGQFKSMHTRLHPTPTPYALRPTPYALRLRHWEVHP